MNVEAKCALNLKNFLLAICNYLKIMFSKIGFNAIKI